MALLVNYEGAYTEPQKLWYLIDDVWKEVVNVYESPIQQEIAVIDAARIDQDKTVNSLITRMEVLQLSLDGTDPSVGLVTDTAAISKINEEIGIITLQLDIAKLEQVAITKQLFEQKAQIEYKKLVLEGEKAIEKISNNVDSIGEWGVIRLDPQDALDERLEVAIQHNLDTNERIFNYGAVYYRLYKLNQINIEDSLADLSNNFKRRLAKTAYAENTLAINFIMSTMTVAEAFTEVSQFVSSGAQRILDFLASLQDQQKYILDNMEMVKDNLAQLEVLSETSDLISKDTDGNMVTNSTNDTLKKPLGKILLDTQGVTEFSELVSQQVMDGITAGTIDSDLYPNYATTTANMSSVEEKISAVSSLKTENDKVLTDLSNGTLKFTSTVAVIGTRKEKVSVSKSLFWSSPLGTSTIATNGEKVSYNQGYTSSGTYKFKTNELVTLSTKYVAIISTILANTKNVQLAVSFGTQPIRIVQVIDANTIQIELLNETSTVAPAIINVEESNTQEAEISLFTNVNEKEQPHTAIPFVKEVNTKNPGEYVDLSVYHPVINTVFYPETYKYQWSASTNINTVIYDRAFVIYEVTSLSDPYSTFGFNAFATMSEYVKTDFTISFIESQETTIGFNAFSTRVAAVRDNIINQTANYTPNAFHFNARVTPLSEKINNFMDNIINQTSNAKVKINFNTYQMRNNEYNPKNGYAQIVNQQTQGLDTLGLSIITDDVNLESLLTTITANDYYSEFSELSRIVITSQTGISIFEIEPEFDYINVVRDSLPKILSSPGVRISDITSFGFDMINYTKADVQLIATTTLVNNTEGKDAAEDNLNRLKYRVTVNSTLINNTTYTPTVTDDTLNKDSSSIVSFATQLNPGVLI